MIVALPAHAKLNLSLAVHGLRPDGHHEITTVFQAISLHDLLLAQPAETTTLTGGRPDDLVLRAQRALEAASGRPLPARFHLLKRIPVGAGLGGGSSDAAAALKALARLYPAAVDPARVDLHAVAAQLGADVPFFLRGGAALATGRGERLEQLPPVRGWFALAWPGFEVSTEAVYRRWDEVGGEGENHLTGAAFAVEPRLAQLAARLDGWRLTGSGSAFFKHCASQEQAEEKKRVADRLGCWTAVARPLAAGGDVA